MAGIEPAYKGFAVPCLTTWRHGHAGRGIHHAERDGRIHINTKQTPACIAGDTVILLVLLGFLLLLLLLFAPFALLRVPSLLLAW